MTQVQIDALVGAVDYSLILPGLAAIGAAVIGLYVARKGVQYILSMVKSS
jgi:hypothetical protein